MPLGGQEQRGLGLVLEQDHSGCSIEKRLYEGRATKEETVRRLPEAWTKMVAMEMVRSRHILEKNSAGFPDRLKWV